MLKIMLVVIDIVKGINQNLL